jgi:hypothetical protein
VDGPVRALRDGDRGQRGAVRGGRDGDHDRLAAPRLDRAIGQREGRRLLRPGARRGVFRYRNRDDQSGVDQVGIGQRLADGHAVDQQLGPAPLVAEFGRRDSPERLAGPHNMDALPGGPGRGGDRDQQDFTRVEDALEGLAVGLQAALIGREQARVLLTVPVKPLGDAPEAVAGLDDVIDRARRRPVPIERDGTGRVRVGGIGDEEGLCLLGQGRGVGGRCGARDQPHQQIARDAAGDDAARDRGGRRVDEAAQPAEPARPARQDLKRRDAELEEDREDQPGPDEPRADEYPRQGRSEFRQVRTAAQEVRSLAQRADIGTCARQTRRPAKPPERPSHNREGDNEGGESEGLASRRWGSSVPPAVAPDCCAGSIVSPMQRHVPPRSRRADPSAPYHPRTVPAREQAGYPHPKLGTNELNRRPQGRITGCNCCTGYSNS